MTDRKIDIEWCQQVGLSVSVRKIDRCDTVGTGDEGNFFTISSVSARKASAIKY